MHMAVLVLHYFVCIFLMIVILLQAGKGAEMGATFGGSSQTIFGGRGPATFFQKLTTIVALIFLVTSVALAQMAKTEKKKSVLESVPPPNSVADAPSAQEVAAPVVPVAPVEQKPVGETPKPEEGK